MDAVQEGIDMLAGLEERITRAAQAIAGLRGENIQLQEQLKLAQEKMTSAQTELVETHAMSAEFQKENSALEAQISQLNQELEVLRGERKQVKTRIEKLLNQLDLLSAT